MKNILLFLFLFVGLTLSAQNITWSPLSKEGKKANEHHLMKIDDNTFLDVEENWSRSGVKLNLVKYNTKTLKEEKRVVYERKGKDRVYSTIMGAEMLGDKMYLFTVKRAKDKKSSSFYSEEIDPVTLKTSNRKVLLKVKLRKQSRLSFLVRDGSGGFSYSVSPNKSKIVIKAVYYTKSKETPKSEVIVFDENLEKLWSRGLKMKSTVQVDDGGNLYYFGKTKDALYVHIYMDNGDNYQKHKISSRNLSLSPALKLWSPEPGVYNVFTFYHKINRKNKKRDLDKYHGYFFQQINANDDMTLDAQTIPFPKDYPYLGLTGWIKATKKMNKRVDAGDGLLGALDIDNVLYDKSSGNSTISMEEYYVIVRQSSKSTTYTYYYNHIAVLQLNKDGELNWHHAINKSQLTNGKKEEYMSYAIAPLGANFYIFFNDVKSNTKKRAENKKTARYKGKSGEVMSFKITNDGKMSKEKVHSFDKSIHIYPKFYRVDKDTQIIFAKGAIGKLKA